jgi:hypothetical protein
MAYAGGVDPNFIIITHAPCEGREKRRSFVRHRVMLNYHAQKQIQKKQRQKVQKHEDGSVSTIPKTQTRSSRKTKILTRLSTSSCPPPSSSSSSSSSSSIHRPPQSAHLLLPKLFPTTAPGAHSTSQTMLRFFCGQVRKATRGLSSVAFVHGRVVEADDGNPLMACRDLLRRYGTVEGGMGREGWRRVGEMQDGIYVEVCTS